MSTRLSARVTGAVVLPHVVTAAPAGETVPPWYPEALRQWTVTRFRLQGPASPNYERQGGFRHFYANDAALARVAVMHKDSRRHAATGGWYFNIFTGGGAASGLAPRRAKSACFDAGHRTQEARDCVFSDPRR